jgi:YndJ-like protein
MKTMVRLEGEKQIADSISSLGRVRAGRDDNGIWARAWATAGAVVWAGMAVLARMGIARVGAIELLFLFAPLVIVPLGMELGRGIGGAGRLEEWGRRLQPMGAGFAVVAMWLPLGRRAAAVSLGWMVICLLMAGGGVVGLVRALWADADRSVRATLAIARIDLMVGGAWLVASRLGMRPMGIQEPIGLLTAVHFHFAGFATATIAAATLQFAGRAHIPSTEISTQQVPPLRSRSLASVGMTGIRERLRGDVELRWLRPVVWLVVGLPIVVAVGFVISPAVKMVAAVLFSASVAALAIAVRACGRKADDITARVLLQVAAGAVFASMVLSAAYAVADFAGSDALTIPQMARTHGVLNAVGFCLTGLLGWLVEGSGWAK